MGVPVSDHERREAYRCLVVGEVAQAHDGSLGLAHAFIDAIASAGANAVKFQTHIAGAESTNDEPWRVRFSLQDETRYQYWQRMEFSEAQWRGLKSHAEDRGLMFLSSPFSVDAVELLERVGMTAWKVASGELGNLTLLDRLVATRLPIILSSGMSPTSELDAAAARVQAAGVPLTVLQCTSMYPCPPEKVGIHMIPAFRQRYGCDVGLSDHSGTVYPGLAAATLGADMIEVHVTLSREMFGPDQAASITTAELRQLVDGVNFIMRMRTAPLDKDQLSAETAPLRALFTKSLAPRIDVPRGTVLRTEHLTLKKPGTGIAASRIAEIVGRRARRDLKANELVRECDLEEAP